MWETGDDAAGRGEGTGKVVKEFGVVLVLHPRKTMGSRFGFLSMMVVMQFLSTLKMRVVACARDGDYLMTRFQCGKCHFRYVQGRNPEFGNRRDALFERCIRRATLDAFWSKEDTTAKGTRTSIRAAMNESGHD